MNYKLDIISQHPDHPNKVLRKHKVEAIDTVGVQMDERFIIRFTNNSYQKVQVKISLDGIDIMTGGLATTEPTQEMWVVRANSTLEISAWPETDNGGASLIFSHAGNSVAIHTNGDLSHRGIIAAAVYVEEHIEPLTINPFTITTIVHEYPYWAQPYYYPYNHYYDPYYYGTRVVWNSNYGLGGASGGGPVALYDGYVAQNVENGWQYTKVYEYYTNDGEPNEDYFKWAQNGWKSGRANRYPMGKGVIPIYSYWEGKKLSYVEARKQIYIPLYTGAVQKTFAFQKLKSIYDEGHDICLWDFDAHGLAPGTFDYWDLVNNEKIKVGHAYVLGMLLEGIIA